MHRCSTPRPLVGVRPGRTVSGKLTDFAPGQTVLWWPTGWGKWRDDGRYRGTVVGVTAKRVRCTFHTNVQWSYEAVPGRPDVPCEPFTICVSPSRISIDKQRPATPEEPRRDE